MTTVEPADAVRTITITNQGKRNALDDTARRQLLSNLDAAVTDPTCRAIVLCGAGDDFCAGGDIASMPTDEPSIRKRIAELHDIVRLVVAGTSPVVAAVEGSAFGSGWSLAAAADHVIAASDARFGCAFGKLGLIPDTGLLWSLSRRIGPARTRTIALRSETIGADEAARIGAVDQVVEPGSALRAACDWAQAVALGAPMANARVKAILTRSHANLDELLAAEIDAQVGLLASADFQEGRTAFFERRPARFSGN